jgi:hypothetical protein
MRDANHSFASQNRHTIHNALRSPPIWATMTTRTRTRPEGNTVHRTARHAAALAATALTLALAACSPATTGNGSNGSNGDRTPTPATSTAAAAAATAALPNLVGTGLQTAQDTAQAAGFYHLVSHDSLGRARHQILDRDWKVCSQTPAAGQHDTSATVDLGAVKLAESCPAKDASAPAKAAGTMPDFKGKSLAVARTALGTSTSITTKDASSNGRMILVESNWQVCAQTPAAGAKLSGQPVAFTAVKFGETCP